MSEKPDNLKRFRIDDLVVDTGTRRVVRGEEVIDLPKLSFDLLLALERAAPDVMTIDDLAKAVWGEVVVSDETVIQRVKMLRDALDKDGDKQRYIETLRSVGYRLRPPVESGAVRRRPTDVTINRMLLGFSVALIAVLVAIWYLRSLSVEAPVEPKAQTVAVLPFVAMSSGVDDGYFADGLTEEILNALTQLPELLVTARTSAFFYKGKDVPIPEIAATLGVAHVVEGSIRREGERVRITAQLIRAQDGFHVWSDTYDRTLDDVFGVQIDIAEKIAASLDIVLDEAERARMRAVGVRNPEAFIAYQKGVEIFGDAHGSPQLLELLAEANRYFEQAVELEPEFTDAYLLHADYYSHILLYVAAGDTVEGISEQDIADAAVALEADFDAAALSANDERRRASVELDQAVFLGNWQGLAARLDPVLTDPICGTPTWLDVPALPYGKAEAAREMITSAVECDPLDFGARLQQIRLLTWLGEFEAAIEASRISAETIGHPLFRIAPVVALMAMGKQDEAEALVEQSLDDEVFTSGARLWLAIGRGDAENGRILLERNRALFGYNPASVLAFNALLGEREGANRIAIAADATPFGHMVLANAIATCFCGAPFDLEATPNFARMIETSDLAWPPTTPVEWPLKTW